MEIFRIVGVGIIGAVISVFLKNSKPEFVIFSVMATGVILLLGVLTLLRGAIEEFSAIVDRVNIDRNLFSSILRIIGIGYVTEYSAELCNDMDCKSIASKIELAGKVVIFLFALPIMTTFLNLIVSLAG
jgi:stage III sporulation protein AD